MGWESALQERKKDVAREVPKGWSTVKEIWAREQAQEGGSYYASQGSLAHVLDKLACDGELERMKVAGGGAYGWVWAYKD